MDEKNDKIKSSPKVNTILIAVVFSVFILILALSWNLWFHHIIFAALGGRKTTQNYTIYVIIITVLTLIIIFSLSDRLEGDINIL